MNSPIPQKLNRKKPSVCRAADARGEIALMLNSTRRFLLVLVILSMSLFALAGCGDDDEPEIEKVKIALSVPLGMDVGQDVVNAAQMALDEAGGKAGDVEVELVALDVSEPDGNPVSPELEAEMAKQALEDDAIVAYLGPMTTDQAKASIPILNEGPVAQVSESATWPGLTKPGFGPGEPGMYYPTGRRHFFRVTPSDDVQAVAAALWIDDLGLTPVFIVDEGIGFGKGLSGIVDLALQDRDITVAGHISLEEGADADALRAAAETVVEAEPELVYFSGGLMPFGGDFVSILRELEPELPIMGPDGLLQDELISVVGAEQAEGLYATSLTVPASEMESAADFIEKYQAAYDKEPQPYIVAAYEGMKVLLTAIEKADSPTREGVLEAISSLGTYEGVFGTWEFDANGDISLTVSTGWQVQDGSWVFLNVIE
jgi:branched-chain amino acid transport system substrate-binding protein